MPSGVTCLKYFRFAMSSRQLGQFVVPCQSGAITHFPLPIDQFVNSLFEFRNANLRPRILKKKQKKHEKCHSASLYEGQNSSYVPPQNHREPPRSYLYCFWFCKNSRSVSAV